MLLLPLFERLTSYLLGMAVWCLVLGPENPLGVDLMPAGVFALLTCLGCVLVMLAVQRQRRAARADERH